MLASGRSMLGSALKPLARWSTGPAVPFPVSEPHEWYPSPARKTERNRSSTQGQPCCTNPAQRASRTGPSRFTPCVLRKRRGLSADWAPPRKSGAFQTQTQTLERSASSVSRSKKCRRLTSKPTVIFSPLRDVVRGSTRATKFSSLPLVERYR